MSNDDATWRLDHVDGDDRGAIQSEWQGGWETAVPEPFWFRRRFRWRPGCYACQLVLKDREEWGATGSIVTATSTASRSENPARGPM